MRKIAANALPPELQTPLATQQAKINALADYAEQVYAAKYLWANKDRHFFEQIRNLLEVQCPGIRRCHYCEDSAADEVEHVWPKDIYPEKTFDWGNYLFACGPCNGSHKRDQFAVFDANGQIIELARKSKAPVLPPASGAHVFLDPHLDDPLEFMEFDPQTGMFVEIDAPPTRSFVRAEYTLRVLGLNRDYLKRSRKAAFKTWLTQAHAYTGMKQADSTEAKLLDMLHHLQTLPFPSVWAEIKRRASQRGEYQDIFGPAPELLSI